MIIKNKANSNLFEKMLITFDLAQNHMGDVNKGISIINDIGKIANNYTEYFNFCFKLQYRDIKSFIHKDYKDRFDFKYVKRFSECQLTEKEFLRLKEEIESFGFYTATTPFDEESVDKLNDHNFDICKIASVSFSDFPLLEKVVELDKPIILSTAAVSLQDIDRVVLFLNNKSKEFSLLHCRAEYPVKYENLELNQIDLLKKRYDVPIGFSSHESPEDDKSIDLCIAKGCSIYECHVDNDDKTRNAYSKNPKEIDFMLDRAVEALEICGVKNERYKLSEKEQKDLAQFKRGLFVKKNLKENEKITKDKVYFAWPSGENQVCANDYSKYKDFILKKDIEVDEPVFFEDVTIMDRQELTREIYEKVKKFLLQSKIAIPDKFEMEISTHYGLESFIKDKIGACIITIINNKYAKKLLILLPGMKHPKHFHQIKIEDFVLLYGDMNLVIYNDINSTSNHKHIDMKIGEAYRVDQKIPHSFSTTNGCIIEEVSLESLPDDSFYDDDFIMNNKDRKTKVIFSR